MTLIVERQTLVLAEKTASLNVKMYAADLSYAVATPFVPPEATKLSVPAQKDFMETQMMRKSAVKRSSAE